MIYPPLWVSLCWNSPSFFCLCHPACVGSPLGDSSLPTVKGSPWPKKVLGQPCTFMILPICCAIRIIPEASHSQTSLGKKKCPTSCVSQTFWTHRCSSTSLSGPWQQLGNSSSSGHIVWRQRPRFPSEHSHYLKAFPSTIGLRSWTKSHSLTLFKKIFSPHLPVNFLDSFCIVKMDNGLRSQIMVCTCEGGQWSLLVCSA